VAIGIDQDLLGVLVHRHGLADPALRNRIAVRILCSPLHRIRYVESKNMLSKLPRTAVMVWIPIG
jgi:hypothetical protein